MPSMRSLEKGKMGTIINLKGKRFGRLVVLSKTRSTQWGSVKWKCKCDCGQQVVTNGASLRYKRTLSCGCWRLEWGERNSRPEAARNKVWRAYIHSARVRSLVFSLTAKRFNALIQGDCYYCGDPPSLEAISFAGNSIFYNGIDRLNPKFGYTNKNSVSCCWPCNLMKRAMSLHEFLRRTHRIVEHTEGLWKT